MRVGDRCERLGTVVRVGDRCERLGWLRVLGGGDGL